MGNPSQLSVDDARRLLSNYHFRWRNLRQAVLDLGSLQYDPLKPMGKNPDLVLQARVRGYREDDWQALAYRERDLYDAWDKQACLVPTSDWPYRRVYHRHFRREWGERVLDHYPEAVRDALRAVERRGPLSSLDLGDSPRPERFRGSWHGPKLTKQVLRGLWYAGELVTADRDKGRHLYDLPERVIPARWLGAPDPGEEASLRHLLELRVRSAGLLAPNASTDIWWVPTDAVNRRQLLRDLVHEGRLSLVRVSGRDYYAAPALWRTAEEPSPRGMRFVAPLDPLMWHRSAVAHLFDFEYLWEVYKPASQRRWGYYVLPVWHQGRFVARIGGKRQAAPSTTAKAAGDVTLTVESFAWERRATTSQLAALSSATRRFAAYLRVAGVSVAASVDDRTRAALLAAND